MNDSIKKVQMCMAQNIPKFVISLLLMGMITTLMMAFTILPIASAIMSTSTSISSMIMLIVITVAVSSIQYVLQYGFFVLVFLLYTGNYAVLGHLFSGFRDFKRAFIIGLIFTSVYMIILLGISFAFALLLSAEIITLTFDTLLVILGLISFVVLAVLYVFCAFSWFLLYENHRMTVKEALLQSISITSGARITFVKFCVRCASYFLPVAIICIVVIQAPLFIPAIDSTSHLYVSLVSVLNFLYIICMYVTLMRISIAFAAWYVSYTESAPAMQAIDQRYALLPNKQETFQDNLKDSNDE